MDISNKSLAMFLVAAIVVSIAGTVISLNKLGSMGQGPTGFATSGSGNVTLDVSSEVAIVLDDFDIDFGTCTPDSANARDVNISSVLADGNGTPGGVCTGADNDGIEIRSSGNLNANVTMNYSLAAVGDFSAGGTFLQSPRGTSRVWYKVTNASADIEDLPLGGYGGCYGPNAYIQSSWKEMTGATDEDRICYNLSNQPGGYNSVRLDVNITLPWDVTQDDEFTLTIWAKQS